MTSQHENTSSVHTISVKMDQQPLHTFCLASPVCICCCLIRAFRVNRWETLIHKIVLFCRNSSLTNNILSNVRKEGNCKNISLENHAIPLIRIIQRNEILYILTWFTSAKRHYKALHIGNTYFSWLVVHESIYIIIIIIKIAKYKSKKI